MRPSNEIFTANDTEKSGTGWIARAGMEKSQLLHCLCDVIGVDGNPRKTKIGAQVGRTIDVVMQRYCLQFLCRVLFACKDVVVVLGYHDSGGAKVDFAIMCTKF